MHTLFQAYARVSPHLTLKFNICNIYPFSQLFLVRISTCVNMGLFGPTRKSGPTRSFGSLVLLGEIPRAI